MQPFEKYQSFIKQFPESKDVFKKMQAWHIANKPNHGIFVPSGELYTLSPSLAQLLSSGKLNKDFTTMTQQEKGYLNLFWGLSVFGAWRNTLGIYEINDNLFDTLVNTNIPDDTPCEIFDRLPEWCVYVAFPDNQAIPINFKDDDYLNHQCFIYGFWVLADMQAVYKNNHELQVKVLNFHLNIESSIDNVFNNMQPLQLLLEDGLTIKQSMEKHARMIHESFAPDKDILITQQQSRADYQLINKLLSILLMICPEEPDISNIQGEPIPKIDLSKPKYTANKRTGTFIPPSKPFLYEIGRRMGGEIKQANDKLASAKRTSTSRRPHIRSAHYHGYWMGTGQDKHYTLKWIAPIFVNG